MSKTLRDLNWSLFIVNILGAIALGTVISLGAGLDWEAAGLTIASCAAKDALAFFSNAKKILSEE